MPESLGLQTNLISWFLIASLGLLWMGSVPLIPGWKREGWPSILKSLYGLVWIGFGIDILLRFLMLTYNAVEWGNHTMRLAVLAPGTINLTLAYCGIFWLLVSVSFWFTSRRGTPGLLSVTQAWTPGIAYAMTVPTAVACSAVFYYSAGPNNLPLELLTPLSLLGNLYIVPAGIIWWEHFQKPGPKWRISAVHVIALLPAVVRAWRSPYRENLAPVILIPLIAAIIAGTRLSLRRLIPGVLVCAFLLSAVIGTYRQMKWDNVRVGEVANEMRRAALSEWIEGTWDEPIHRFHAFDSMLLTVSLVPAMEPYSGRDVLISPFIRGFIPRFVNSGKGATDEGVKFGERIWAFDDPEVRARRVGSIAPSMPGDLYDAGGLLYVVLGSLIWGLVLGLVDGWKKHLPGFTTVAITCLLATQCLMSIERDFDNTVATLIQTLVVFALAAGVIGLTQHHGTQRSTAFGEFPQNV